VARITRAAGQACADPTCSVGIERELDRAAMPSKPSRELGALIATALFVHVTSGCVSNEYLIPKRELQRVASLPPEVRGARVGVVQGLGERRADAIAPHDEVAEGPSANVDIRLDGLDPGPSSGGNWRPAPASGGPNASPTSGGWRPAPASGGPNASPPSGGWRGPAASGGSKPGPAPGGFHGTPPSGGHGGGGGGFSLGGGGGGGGGGNDAAVLAVVAVVLVTAAVIGTIGLVASEGIRFDGYAQLAPDQPIHIKDDAGRQYDVPLALVTPELAAHTREAKVMDDEWYGMRRLDAAPLDRRGGVFRLELGTSAFNYGTTSVVGPAAHIQLGYFPAREVGLLAEIGLSGATDCCQGPQGGQETIVRHSLALELDLLPLEVGRFHAGVFGKGGLAIAAADNPWEEGPLGGGGTLVEIDLTPRMALAFRAGMNATRLPSGWSSAGTLTAGIAIY
jgi:hypothetical protein